MDEMEKLRHLIEHWLEHNQQHALSYREWAEKARSSGNGQLSDALIKVAEAAEDMQVLFKNALLKAS